MTNREINQMNFEPFLNAGPVIQIHMTAAFAALVLGGVVLWRRKGTARHKLYGKAWIVLMAIVALSSFFINELRTFGPFSAIHVLSVITLVSLVQAVSTVRNGNIQRHQFIIKGLFFGGLVGAGIFTFMPGRILYRTFFGKPEFYLTSLSNAWVLPFIFALIIGAFIFWRMRVQR